MNANISCLANPLTKRLRHFPRGGAVLAAAVLMASAVSPQAATVMVNASNTGNYERQAGSPSSYVGAQPTDGSFHSNAWSWWSPTIGLQFGGLRSYFVFDLPALQSGEEIVSATLRLFDVTSSGNFSFTLFDVEHSIPTLLTVRTPSTYGDIYFDLYSGTSYGETGLLAAATFDFIDITINADGLLALNVAAGGGFALGGGVSNDNSTFYGGGPGDQLSLLTLEITEPSAVPEPGSAVALALLLTSSAALHRRRRR